MFLLIISPLESSLHKSFFVTTCCARPQTTRVLFWVGSIRKNQRLILVTEKKLHFQFSKILHYYLDRVCWVRDSPLKLKQGRTKGRENLVISKLFS